MLTERHPSPTLTLSTGQTETRASMAGVALAQGEGQDHSLMLTYASPETEAVLAARQLAWVSAWRAERQAIRHMLASAFAALLSCCAF